jgi:hypothetical protein
VGSTTTERILKHDTTSRDTPLIEHDKKVVLNMTTVRTQADPGQRSILADRIGRSLMGFNALLTVGAVIYGVTQLLQASPDTLVVEAWRTFGFLVFLSLNLMVALWPRKIAGAWELILLHKIAVTVFAMAVGTANEAEATAWIDGWLVISTIGAYVLTRGWLAWGTLRRAQ